MVTESASGDDSLLQQPPSAAGSAAAAAAAAAASSSAARLAAFKASDRFAKFAARRPKPIVFVAAHHMHPAAAPAAAAPIKRPVDASAAPHADAVGDDAAAHACDLCPRRFPSLQGLSTHRFRAHNLRATTADGRRKGAAGEPRLRTIESDDLVSIYRIPPADKGEACPLCAARFVGKSALGRHLINDHKDSTLPHFACDDCPRTYRSYDSLLKHQRLDHHRGAAIGSLLPADWEEGELAPGVEPSPCQLCGVVFRSKHRLSMHVMAEHRATKWLLLVARTEKAGVESGRLSRHL